MAGLWRYTQQFQPVALMLVLTVLVHQCLASLQQQQPSASASGRWEIPANENQHMARPLPGLQHILQRSTAANIRDSPIEKNAHNITDVEIVSSKPVLLSEPLPENANNLNSAETLVIETENSSNVVDATPTVQEVEYLETKITNIDPDELGHPSGTERTRISSTAITKEPVDDIACPECVKRQRRLQNLDPEELRYLRIETIKLQILSKLKFERAPNVTRREMNIPVPLSDGHFGGGEEELIDFSTANDIGGEKSYYGKTTQVIITAKDEHMYCPSKSMNAGCFEFDLTQAIGMHVVSAELWVYKVASSTGGAHNQTLVVSQLASRHSRIKKELLRQSVSLQEAGWVTFEMKHDVQNMINHSRRLQRLEIFCDDCDEFENDFPISSKAGYRPFLAISTSEPKPRKPRSIDCTADTADCCRERFYVSFAEIEWDWIIQPKGYHANYCKGSCRGPVIPSYAHTSVIHGVLARDEHLTDMMPCCAPKETKGISLIYYDNEALIYKRELPDMVIESCACS